jgi:hypothetical protein
MGKDTPIIGAKNSKEDFTTDIQTKAMASSIGLPDDLDVKNIEIILRNYNIARPNEINNFIMHAKEEQKNLKFETGSNKNAYTQSGQIQYRRALTMPIGLFRIIQESYPLMFSNKKHLHWFMKKFPMFNVARRV